MRAHSIPSLALLMSLALAACGPIRGEVIEGQGGNARPAANLEVEIFGNPDTYFARCSAITSASIEGAGLRLAFDDSVRRALGAQLNGHREVDLTTEYRLENRLYGDAAAGVIARRDSILRATLPARRVWSGRTDGSGKFSSSWLVAGDYIVEVDGTAHTVHSGLFGAMSQMTYRGYSLPRCIAEPGKLNAYDPAS